MRTLLENVRNMDNASNRDIIRYRREAELNVGSDEHLYKVDWVSLFLYPLDLYYFPRLQCKSSESVF